LRLCDILQIASLHGIRPELRFGAATVGDRNIARWIPGSNPALISHGK
jgi:hypothetical protein